MMFSWFRRRQSTEYDPVSTDPKTVEFIRDGAEYEVRPYSAAPVFPWIAAFLFAMLALYEFFVIKSSELSGSWETGWQTEFGPALHLIEVETMSFTGGTSYDENGAMFIPHPDPIQYVGSPSKEIDQAWRNLISPRYFRISKDEAEGAYGAGYEQFWNPEHNSYLAGLDMFHTLHCLDYVRRFGYSQYYSTDKYEDSAMHFDHCVEHMRQYIMCAGDLTPIPTKFFPSVNHSYVDPERPHTCRNFQKVRDWVLERTSADV